MIGATVGPFAAGGVFADGVAIFVGDFSFSLIASLSFAGGFGFPVSGGFGVRGMTAGGAGGAVSPRYVNGNSETMSFLSEILAFKRNDASCGSDSTTSPVMFVNA